MKKLFQLLAHPSDLSSSVSGYGGLCGWAESEGSRVKQGRTV